MTAFVVSAPLFAADKLAYPQTRTVDQVDTLHGVNVPDPYRWLEDANSADTAAWVKAQNSVTKPYLDSLPERAPFRSKMAEVYNYERFNRVSKEGDNYFWSRHDGKQDRPVLYVSEGVVDLRTRSPRTRVGLCAPGPRGSRSPSRSPLAT